jgi:hypothetical protein
MSMYTYALNNNCQPCPIPITNAMMAARGGGGNMSQAHMSRAQIAPQAHNIPNQNTRQTRVLSTLNQVHSQGMRITQAQNHILAGYTGGTAVRSNESM